MKPITRTTYLLSAVLAGVMLVALTSAPGAPNASPTVLPPNSKPYGASYGEWGGRWWQWALSSSPATNPVVDPTGEFAALGQSGPVWFLAGTYGGTAERTVTVPAGKALFFPILNQCWINMPEYGDNEWSEEQEAYARALIADAVEIGLDLACQIDGVSVADITAYRSTTPEDGEFSVYLPEDNMFDVWYGLWGIDVAEGTYGPSVSDGYYLMVAPLSVGEHTIHFTAGDYLDVTYHITVVGGSE